MLSLVNSLRMRETYLHFYLPGYVSLTFIKGLGLGQYDGACQCNQQGLLILGRPGDQLVLKQDQTVV